MPTIAQTQQQFQEAKQQVSEYEEEAKKISTPPRNLSFQFGIIKSNRQIAGKVEQTIRQRKATKEEALRQAEQAKKDIAESESQFQTYLSSNSGKLQYVQEYNVPIAGYETRFVSSPSAPNGGYDVQVPYYNTPYGKVVDESSIEGYYETEAKLQGFSGLAEQEEFFGVAQADLGSKASFQPKIKVVELPANTLPGTMQYSLKSSPLDKKDVFTGLSKREEFIKSAEQPRQIIPATSLFRNPFTGEVKSSATSLPGWENVFETKQGIYKDIGFGTFQPIKETTPEYKLQLSSFREAGYTEEESSALTELSFNQQKTLSPKESETYLRDFAESKRTGASELIFGKEGIAPSGSLFSKGLFYLEKGTARTGKFVLEDIPNLGFKILRYPLEKVGVPEKYRKFRWTYGSPLSVGTSPLALEPVALIEFREESFSSIKKIAQPTPPIITTGLKYPNNNSPIIGSSTRDSFKTSLQSIQTPKENKLINVLFARKEFDKRIPILGKTYGAEELVFYGATAKTLITKGAIGTGARWLFGIGAYTSFGSKALTGFERTVRYSGIKSVPSAVKSYAIKEPFAFGSDVLLIGTTFIPIKVKPKEYSQAVKSDLEKIPEFAQEKSSLEKAFKTIKNAPRDVRDIRWERVKEIPKNKVLYSEVERFIKEENLVVGGTTAIEAGNIKLRRLPRDVELYSSRSGSLLANKLLKRLKDAGIKGVSQEGGALKFEGIEGHGINFQNIQTLNLERYGGRIYRTPKGLRVADPFATAYNKVFDLLKRQPASGSKAKQLLKENPEAYARAKVGKYVYVRYPKDIVGALSTAKQVIQRGINRYGDLKARQVPILQEYRMAKLGRAYEFIKPYLGKLRTEEAKAVPYYFKGKQPGIFAGVKYVKSFTISSFKNMLSSRLASSGYQSVKAVKETYEVLPQIKQPGIRLYSIYEKPSWQKYPENYKVRFPPYSHPTKYPPIKSPPYIRTPPLAPPRIRTPPSRYPTNRYPPIRMPPIRITTPPINPPKITPEKKQPRRINLGGSLFIKKVKIIRRVASPTEYQPSLSASILGITATKLPKQFGKDSFFAGFRPVIIRKRRKRRRKII